MGQNQSSFSFCKINRSFEPYLIEIIIWKLIIEIQISTMNRGFSTITEKNPMKINGLISFSSLVNALCFLILLISIMLMEMLTTLKWRKLCLLSFDLCHCISWK